MLHVKSMIMLLLLVILYSVTKDIFDRSDISLFDPRGKYTWVSMTQSRTVSYQNRLTSSHTHPPIYQLVSTLANHMERLASPETSESEARFARSQGFHTSRMPVSCSFVG
jgi:hypothetical protein